MAYFVLSRNGEESFNTFLSPNPNPDPDHLRGGPSRGYNTFCLKYQVIKSCGAIVFELRARADKQTDPNSLPSHSFPEARVIKACRLDINSTYIPKV